MLSHTVPAAYCSHSVCASGYRLIHGTGPAVGPSWAATASHMDQPDASGSETMRRNQNAKGHQDSAWLVSIPGTNTRVKVESGRRSFRSIRGGRMGIAGWFGPRTRRCTVANALGQHCTTGTTARYQRYTANARRALSAPGGCPHARYQRPPEGPYYAAVPFAEPPATNGLSQQAAGRVHRRCNVHHYQMPPHHRTRSVP